MNVTHKTNPETAADQSFDGFLKNEFETMANNRPFFSEQADAAAFTAEIMERITREEQAAKTTKKEIKPMKSKKIFIAAIAAVLCLSTATCFALGKITGYVGHSHKVSDQFPSVAKMEQVLDARPDAVENFSNGFRFTEYAVGNFSTYGENDAKIETKPQLSLLYANDAKQTLNLLIHPLLTGQELDGDNVTKIPYNDEITLYYSVQHHKFVPPTYEPTPEEQALVAAGELSIGYGSVDIDDCYMTNLSWVKDGISYCFIGQDLDLTQDDMAQMAAEVIGQNN